ncbi:MAG: SusC/RagA family TonB-linked outer membrane protein [Bacteroidetes bacterium]|nr:MAG: SusC/RagA family TonB-linked outer membrane protein [Bacteroidota bacterium]
MKHFLFSLVLIPLGAIILPAQGTITGMVKDDAGNALVGATVQAKGTSTGTSTGLEGRYKLQVPRGTKELLFSYTGFQPQTISITGRSVVDVVLTEALYDIDEVVVVGYGAKKRSELVGSSAQIKSDELEQIPVSSLDQMLQGKVPGLSISAISGTPGSVSQVRIRGISSVNAGNEPLYVIDGVPVSTDKLAGFRTSSLDMMATLNANDIESVTVLKDASATAAYGARGSNGVIVITTKKGKSGKTKFNLSSSYGFSNDATEGPVMLTAAEREMLFYEALYNTFGESEGFDLAGARAFYEANPNTFGTAYVDWNAAGRPEGNWGDVITNKNAPQREVNFSASGGDAAHNFYASFGYYDSEATVIGSSFKRYTASINVSKSLSSKFRFNTQNTVSRSIQDEIFEQGTWFLSPWMGKYFMPPLITPYNADGSINIEDIKKYTNIHNPLWIADHNINLAKTNRLFSNNSLSWETPVRNLLFTTRYSIDYKLLDYKEHHNRIHGDGVVVGGETWAVAWQLFSYVVQNTLDYTISLKPQHNIEVKFLQEFQKSGDIFLSAIGDGFAADGLTNLVSASTPVGVGSYYVDRALASYAGLLDYDFDKKYIFSAAFRREGNSKFHPDYRWGDFWSVGAAWNLDRETFFGGIGFVNALKLRASYGRTGNDNVALNQYQALFNYSGDYAGEGTVIPTTVGNRYLSWETADNFETGVDFGLFQNRVKGVFSYFRRETKENLFYVPLSWTTGFSNQLQNIGRMENKGLELELSVDVLRSRNLNLTIGGNLATVRNRVLELPLDANGDEINITNWAFRVETGHIVWEWHLPKFAGVDPQTGQYLYYLNEEGVETTTNFNEADAVFLGKSGLPTLTAGMNLHFDFKGLYLEANAYYAGGHLIYNNMNRYTNGADRWSVDVFNGFNVLLNRWQKPGDITDVAKMTYTLEQWRDNSQYLRDGDYLRVKNITLGYTLPVGLTRHLRVEAVKLFVRGINMFTWVKDDRLLYDPEMRFNGISLLTTPPVKTILFGLNLKF